MTDPERDTAGRHPSPPPTPGAAVIGREPTVLNPTVPQPAPSQAAPTGYQPAVQAQPAPYGQAAAQPAPYGQAAAQPAPYGQAAAQPAPWGQPTLQAAPTGYGQPAPTTSPVPTAVPSPSSSAQTTAAGGSATVARPSAQAAAAGAEAPPATALSRAGSLAIGDAGRSGPPVQDDRGPRPTRRPISLSGKLPRLRIGSHVVSRSALAQMRVGSFGTGLVLGADRDRKPVSARVFRPGPTRITLVGGVWAGQLVAFRALALGARVAVVTTEPHAWQGLGEWATGRTDRVSVMTTLQPLAVAADARQPLLIIHDFGLVGAAAPQPLESWQTQLTILRQLDHPGLPAVQDCELVIMQRLGNAEAALVGRALRLPAASTQFLQVMADDMVALVGDGADRYIWLTQSDVERQYAGVPRR